MLASRHFLCEPGQPPADADRTMPTPQRPMATWRRWMAALALHQPPRSRERHENSDVAAGYSYLLQFVAHDMVHMSPMPKHVDDSIAAASDLRERPLLLETLYGPPTGDLPDASPRMRLGPAKLGTALVPDRDIPRQLEANGVKGKPLLADVRNDQHSNLSQLTALFLQLHNAILGLLPPGMPAATAFETARRAVVLLYRDAVRRELLPRILDARVDAIYAQRAPVLEQAVDDARVTLEFSAGAFRFGHAMIRGHYELVGSGGYIGNIVLQTMANPHARMPLGAEWLVRWSRFFDLPGMAPAQRSLCYVPTPPGHTTGGHPPPLAGDVHDTRGGLTYRDATTALLFGLWTPHALSRRIRAREPQFDFLPRPTAARAAIRTWLADGPLFAQAPDARAAIAAAAPLPFYVLFEAWWQGDGKRLGPLGSILVAETICGALARTRPAYETDDLAASLAALDPALAPLAARAGMAGIITFVAEAHGWQATSPAFL